MQRKGVAATEAVQSYVLTHSEHLEPHHLALLDDTETSFGARAELQVPPEEALALRMLVRIVGAERALEIGTFTGLSSMLIAEGLPPGGRLVCLDIDTDTTALARRHWDAAGLGERIELRIGPAQDTLAAMTDETFDFVFVDADKPGYVTYYELVLPRVRPGGLIVADNTMRRGNVADPGVDDEVTEAVRRFNRLVAGDDRVDVVVLPVFDGLSLISKR